MGSNCWATLIKLCVDSLQHRDKEKVVLPWKKTQLISVVLDGTTQPQTHAVTAK